MEPLGALQGSAQHLWLLPAIQLSIERERGMGAGSVDEICRLGFLNVNYQLPVCVAGDDQTVNQKSCGRTNDITCFSTRLILTFVQRRTSLDGLSKCFTV